MCRGGDAATALIGAASTIGCRPMEVTEVMDVMVTAVEVETLRLPLLVLFVSVVSH